MSISSAFASTVSPPLKIVKIRPYMDTSTSGPGAVYIEVSPTFCNTDTVRIDNGWGGAKEAYAAALSSMMADKHVVIEVDTCNGWGTTIRSLSVNK
jgi:hypothetical protein